MFQSTSLTVCLLLGVQGVLSAPTPEPRAAECSTIYQRKSWSALTSDEKSAYIQADLCLMAAPAKSGIPGAITRWDELQYSHIAQASYIHGVGAFLPFHRYYMTVHEYLMRTECDYTGPMAYWDEAADVGTLTTSDVFDVELGFGGNGTGSQRCIADGPFVDLTLHYNEDLTVTDYCISRNINERSFSSAAQANVESCLVQATFLEAWNCFEGRPHGAGHGGVSGTMINPLLSPGDPIFFLHHTYLDKLWWDWQSADLTQRLTEIGGNNTRSSRGGGPPGFDLFMGEEDFVFPPGGGGGGFDQTPNPAFTDYFNDGGNTTTLNHTLWSANLLANATVADVMDIGGSLICAEYA